MKNYEEMANDVLRRISECEAEKKSKMSHRAVTAGAAVSLCTVAALGAGLWKGGAFPAKDSDTKAAPAAQVAEYAQPDTEALLPTAEAVVQPETETKAAEPQIRDFPIPEYEITDKESCFHKLLNCVEYYNYAAGKIETNMFNGNLFTVEYWVDMCEGTGYQHVLSFDFDEEVFVGEGNVRTVGHSHNDEMVLPMHYKSGDISTIEDDEKRITTYDGEPCHEYKVDPTNLHCSSTFSLYPQEMTFGFLENKDLWDITGRTEYLGREVVIVQGTTAPAYGQKLNVSTFTMTIDCKTGILLKFEGYGPSGELTKYMTVKITAEQW